MLITVRACNVDLYDHGVQMTTPSRTISPFPCSLIPVNVPTPYTRVGHCDDARWVSASVFAVLMSHKLAQSLKRSVALWTNIRSLWCLIFTLICCRRNQNWRASPNKTVVVFLTARYAARHAIHVQDAKILHEPIVKKPLHHRSSTPFEKNGAIVKYSKTIHSLPAIGRAPPHADSRTPAILFKNGTRLQKDLHQKRKARRSGGP